MLFSVAYSQEENEFQPCRIWVIAHDSTIFSSSDDQHSEFKIFLSSFEINNITRPFHFAKTPALRSLYEIESCFSEDSLYTTLTKMNRNGSLFLSVEKIPTAKMLSVDPIDPMWLATKRGESDSLWYLMKIDAPGAWAITRGDSNLRVALIDNGIDLTHPDLVGKIDPPRNFYDSLRPIPFLKHGTAVATVLAGETVGWGQKPNGRMASIGYNTKIMFNTSYGSSPLIPCLFASSVLQAKIISISWYYGDHACYPSLVNRKHLNFPSETQRIGASTSQPISDLLVEREILNNGTTIVRSAGNGGHQCGGGPLYPFSGKEDPRVIVVSTTTKRDTHKDDNGYSCSHYPEVDICAPGYSIVAGDTTYKNGENPAPYYYSLATSIATPIVAGVVALMYSVNPCLTSAWTESLLKKSADPILDASEFPGLVGAGRINAHKAVKAALEAYQVPTDLYVRDRWDDFGDQVLPYNTQEDWNNSPDIWLRNQADGRSNQEHQSIQSNKGNSRYIYVRVGNRSAKTSSGTETLKLYCSKARSVYIPNEGLSVPQDQFLIGEISVGKIAPCKDSIFQFEWQADNWDEISNWTLSFYAQLEDGSPPLGILSAKKTEKYVINNNNVAMKNQETLLYAHQKQHEKNIILRNHYTNKKRFDLIFSADSNAFSHGFTKKDFVQLTFDEESWSIFKKHLVKHSQIEIIGERQVRFMHDSISFFGIRIPPKIDLVIRMQFDFSQQQMPPNSRSDYHVRQSLVSDGRLLGGHHFTFVN